MKSVRAHTKRCLCACHARSADHKDAIVAGMTVVVTVNEVACTVLQASWRLPVNRELDRLRRCKRSSRRELHLINRYVVCRRPELEVRRDRRRERPLLARRRQCVKRERIGLKRVNAAALVDDHASHLVPSVLDNA